MPVTKCMEDGKPGYKWGEKGKCYTYDENDIASKHAAYDKMKKQMKAIEASKYGARRFVENCKDIIKKFLV